MQADTVLFHSLFTSSSSSTFLFLLSITIPFPYYRHCNRTLDMGHDWFGAQPRQLLKSGFLDRDVTGIQMRSHFKRQFSNHTSPCKCSSVAARQYLSRSPGGCRVSLAPLSLCPIQLVWKAGPSQTDPVTQARGDQLSPPWPQLSSQLLKVSSRVSHWPSEKQACSTETHQSFDSPSF